MKKNDKSGFALLTIIMPRSGYKTHPVVSIDSGIPDIYAAFRAFFLKIFPYQDIGEVVFTPIVKFKQYQQQQSDDDYLIDQKKGKCYFHHQ
jgi:hypothetical protein